MTALDSDYEKAGFGGQLHFGDRPALVIVDMVKAYLDPECPLYAGESAEAALTAMITLRDAAREAAIPVVLTGVSYKLGGVDGGMFYKKVPALKHFDEGSPFAAFPENLCPEGDDILLMKKYPSAFFGTSLASTLTAMGIDTVVLGGYSTSGCVRASALDALQYGFAPFVVRQATADRDPGPHEANLFDLQAKYAEVADLDWMLKRLESAGG